MLLEILKRFLWLAVVAVALGACSNGGGDGSGGGINNTSPSTNYTVIVSANPSSGGSVNGDGVYAQGTSVTVSSTPSSGYNFVNWTENGNPVSGSTTYAFPAENRTLVANFEPEHYSIIASASPSIAGNVVGSGVYAHGNNVTLTASANSGYGFVNWTEGGTEVSTSLTVTFTVTGVRTLVANFAKYTIDTSAIPGAGGTISGAGSYAHGANVTLTAIPTVGYTFIDWTEGGIAVSTSPSFNFVATTSRILNANFLLNSYSVSTSAIPSSQGTISGGGTFTHGTSVTVTATPNAGYSFRNWTENGTVVSTNANYTFTATTERTLVANFGAPVAVIPTLNFGLKQFIFGWTAVAGAAYYKLLENPDGISGYKQLGGDFITTSATIENVSLINKVNARYIISACNLGGCTDSDALFVVGTNLVKAIGYFKASNTYMGDEFGSSVALSADGSTLAVGAWREASAATGINGNQNDNSADSAGAVYVFIRSGGAWSQQAYVKASNTNIGVGDWFGHSVTLSADGNTMAVGAWNEGSAATGINGNQASNGAYSSGAVYVFTRSGTTWSQQAYVKASNTNTGDYFGYRVALSADGDTMAVGAWQEASAATGINGNQDDNSMGSGAVYVFTRSNTTWSQQAYVKASNTFYGIGFGFSVALSADGNTMAVGAWWEASAATGINGNQDDKSTPGAGAVYVFTRSGTTWSQQAYVKASNTGEGDGFGYSVALSEDGNTMAVGASDEDSAATGINGNQSDNSFTRSGAVYVFTRSSTTWSQQAYIKASNTYFASGFGYSVALSADGNTLAVGAPYEFSNATGINGSQTNTGPYPSGAVYVFIRNNTTWLQHVYVKASNTGNSDEFGIGITLSANGDSMAVGAWKEASSATGINGDQTINVFGGAGAVYLY